MEKLLSGGMLRIYEDGRSLYMDDDQLSVAGALFLRPFFKGIFSKPDDE